MCLGWWWRRYRYVTTSDEKANLPFRFSATHFECIWIISVAYKELNWTSMIHLYTRLPLAKTFVHTLQECWSHRWSSSLDYTASGIDMNEIGKRVFSSLPLYPNRPTGVRQQNPLSPVATFVCASHSHTAFPFPPLSILRCCWKHIHQRQLSSIQGGEPCSLFAPGAGDANSYKPSADCWSQRLE